MRRSDLGGPQPASAAEIVEALGEMDLPADEAAALVFAPGETADPDFTGWCAEISEAETGAKRITTLAFADRASLDAALHAAGIFLIEEPW